MSTLASRVHGIPVGSRVQAENRNDIAEAVGRLESENAQLHHDVALLRVRAEIFEQKNESLAAINAEVEQENDALQAENEELRARRDELLATIVRLTNELPYPEEVRNWTEQRKAMIAEIGTLKARIAEFERSREYDIEMERW